MWGMDSIRGEKVESARMISSSVCCSNVLQVTVNVSFIQPGRIYTLFHIPPLLVRTVMFFSGRSRVKLCNVAQNTNKWKEVSCVFACEVLAR